MTRTLFPGYHDSPPRTSSMFVMEQVRPKDLILAKGIRIQIGGALMGFGARENTNANDIPTHLVREGRRGLRKPRGRP